MQGVSPEKVLKEGGGGDSSKEVKLYQEGECGSHVGRPTGLGKATLVLFRARNTLEELPRWRRGGERRGRGPHPPQQLLTQEHSHCHPPSFLAFIISCNISESSFYIWRQCTRPRWQISNPSTASRPFEKGFKGNVSGDQTMI